MQTKRIYDIRLLALFSIVAVFSFLFFLPIQAVANAPKQVEATYDSSTKTLTVTITHTFFSSSHYIEKVAIRKNGADLMTQTYTSQPSETFTYTYTVEAVSGDTLDVKATCSWFGSRSAQVTVGP